MTPPSVSPQRVSRVLMTADAVGGVWTFCVELARVMAPHGVEVALAVMGPPPNAAQRRLIESLTNVDLRIGEFALEWMDHPWKEVDDAERWLQRLHDEFSPDVVHLNGYVHAAMPWPVPVVITAHSCVTTWWEAVEGTPLPARYHEYRQRVQRGLSNATLVVAPTAAMMRSLSGFYELPVTRRIVANGRSQACFAPGAKEPFIFSAGRIWDKAKNLRLLADIAPDLPISVRLAGDGGSPSSNVEYLGALSEREVSEELSRAAIYAAPALYEPFGLSILEAGLSRCALVLADLPSLREVWQDAAIYVPADSPRKWRNTLRELIHEPLRMEDLGRRALARAQEFTPERCAHGYVDCYEAALRERAVQPRRMAA